MRKGIILLLICLCTWEANATQTYLGAHVGYFTGPTTNSHVNQLNYGLLFQAETDGAVRYVLGFSAIYGSLNLDVAETSYSVLSLDLNLRLGMQIDLSIFQRNRMRPILAAYGLGGANMITSSAPPTDVSQSVAAYGWGYEFEFGIHLRTFGKSGIRFTAGYRDYRYTYASQSISSDAFHVRTGLVF